MSISVIIPVYNCEKWLEQSIDSARQFDVVQQILVIDDGSTDRSREVANRCAQADPRVEVYHHVDAQNKGRSATRNLGLSNARLEWIAFLDADDYFLSNRFDGFEVNADVDGYYGTIGTESTISNMDMAEVGLKRPVDSQDLYKHLTSSSDSYFSIISLTVKKDALSRIGGFDEELLVGEDTDLIWRLAHKCRLTSLTGSESVAMRRLHEHNADRDSIERSSFYDKWLKQPPYPVNSRAQKRLFYAALEYQQPLIKRSWLYKKLLYYRWILTGKTAV